jgi:Mycobacterium membrane protein
MTTHPRRSRRSPVKIANGVRLGLSAVAITALSGILAPVPAHADSNTVTFEVFGPGSVYTIDTDPATDRVYEATLPWRRSITVGPDVQMFQVVAVGKDSPGPGCRILIGVKQVVEQPVGGPAHCIFTR